MRKIVMLPLAVVMLLALAAPALASAPHVMVDWNQVPEWARAVAEDIVRWEIMNGYPVKGKPVYYVPAPGDDHPRRVRRDLEPRAR